MIRSVRLADVQASERVQTQVDTDDEGRRLISGDHRVDGGREVGAASPVGEQVHVLAGALQDPVRGDRMPAGQGEPVYGPPICRAISASRRWIGGVASATTLRTG